MIENRIEKKNKRTEEKNKERLRKGCKLLKGNSLCTTRRHNVFYTKQQKNEKKKQKNTLKPEQEALKRDK